MTIRNYTTTIKVEKTIMEIENILVKFGARGIYKEYKGQSVSGIMFYIERDNQKIPFKIPMKLEKARAIIDKLSRQGKLTSKFRNDPLRSEQAERVCWRIIKDWIDSQLSLLEMDFVDSLEILLPYMWDGNKTFYEKILENKEKYIETKIEFKEE